MTSCRSISLTIRWFIWSIRNDYWWSYVLSLLPVRRFIIIIRNVYHYSCYVRLMTRRNSRGIFPRTSYLCCSKRIKARNVIIHCFRNHVLFFIFLSFLPQFIRSCNWNRRCLTSSRNCSNFSIWRTFT